MYTSHILLTNSKLHLIFLKYCFLLLSILQTFTIPYIGRLQPHTSWNLLPITCKIVCFDYNTVNNDNLRLFDKQKKVENVMICECITNMKTCFMPHIVTGSWVFKILINTLPNYTYSAYDGLVQDCSNPLLKHWNYHSFAVPPIVIKCTNPHDQRQQ